MQGVRPSLDDACALPNGMTSRRNEEGEKQKTKLAKKFIPGFKNAITRYKVAGIDHHHTRDSDPKGSGVSTSTTKGSSLT